MRNARRLMFARRQVADTPDASDSPFHPGTKRLKPGWRYPGGGKPPVKAG